MVESTLFSGARFLWWWCPSLPYIPLLPVELAIPNIPTLCCIARVSNQCISRFICQWSNHSATHFLDFLPTYKLTFICIVISIIYTVNNLITQRLPVCCCNELIWRVDKAVNFKKNASGSWFLERNKLNRLPVGLLLAFKLEISWHGELLISRLLHNAKQLKTLDVRRSVSILPKTLLECAACDVEELFLSESSIINYPEMLEHLFIKASIWKNILLKEYTRRAAHMHAHAHTHKIFWRANFFNF